MTGSRGSTLRRYRARLDPWWLAASVLLLWSLGEVVLPMQLPGRSAATYWGWGGLGVVLLAGLLLARDAAESWARSGTARSRDELITAAVGVAVTLSLSALATLAAWSIARSGGSVLAAGALFYLATASLAVAVTALLPGLSPDGGKLLHAAIWRWTGDAGAATRTAYAVASATGVALVLIGLWAMAERRLLAAVWLLTLGGMLLTAQRRAALLGPEPQPGRASARPDRQQPSGGSDSSPRRSREAPVSPRRRRRHPT